MASAASAISKTPLKAPGRWGAIALFVVASSYLNFLDRQLLSAAAPTLREEFSLSNAQYGELMAVFAFAYAASTPLMGLLIDRLGLSLGMTISVSLWSLASALTTRVTGLTGLLFARGMLGVGESAAIPGASKATATYLPPQEFGFANAVGAVAVALGSISAPLLIATAGEAYGWRSVFLFSGLLGFLWIIAWHMAGPRLGSHTPAQPVSLRASAALLADPRLWWIAIAYAMVMVEYTLWMNWTTLYLVDARQLSQQAANQYFAWLPPVFATLGGFFGATLAFRWIRQGTPAVQARVRVLSVSVVGTLATMLVPLSPTPILAVLAIGISFFSCMSIISAVHVLPVDLFGIKHAAFSASILAGCYALLQAVVSPLIGSLVDRFGFGPICLAVPLFPLLSLAVIGRIRPRTAQSSG